MPLSSSRRQAALARAVLTSATDFAIVTTGLDGRVTSWNPGAEHLLGWSADKIMGEDACLLFTPEDRAAGDCDREMTIAREQGRAEDERWHMKKDGSRLWASGLLMRFEDDESGEHIGYLKILRDRTPQHQANEAMRESERQYRTLAEALPGFVFATDAAGRKIYANDCYQQFTGRDMDALAGDGWLQALHPDDRDGAASSWRATVTDGQPYTNHLRFRRHDGAHRTFRCQALPERDDEGEIVRWVGTCIDVEDQRQAEAHIAYEKGLLDAVVGQAPIGISIAPADDEAQPVINAFMRRMLGHGIGGSGVRRYVSYGALHADGTPYTPDDYPTVRALRQGERVEGELMRYRQGPDGPNPEGSIRRLAMTSGPVRDAGGTIVAAVTIAQDVEDSLSATERLAQLATERERALGQARQMAGLVEQSNDFVGEAALDGSVAFVNPAGLALVGLHDLEAARSTRIIDYFTPASQEVVAATVLPAVQATGYWEGELEFRHFETDQAIPVLYNIFPLRGVDGAVSSYGTVTRDLRERRQADRLRFGLADLSDRLRNIDDPGAMQDAASEVIGAALGVGRVGYGAVAPDGETFTVPSDWTAPGFPSLAGTYRIDDYGRYAEDLRQGSTVVIGDVRTDPRTSDNPEPLIAVSVGSLINHPVVELGRTVAILYVNDREAREWRDDEVVFLREAGDRLRQAIERRRVEVELRALNDRLEAEVEARTAERDRMWNTSPDLMLVLSLDGFYRRANPSWTAILGYEPEDVIGLYFTDLTHLDDMAKTEAALASCRTGPLLSFENRLRHKDGNYRWVQWVAAAGTDEIFANGRHITEAKEQQERLAEAEERLRQSQKMEAVGQLTGGLAHDFNNLLTGITGSLELMTIRIGQGRMVDVEKYNVAAQGAAKRAAALTHRLLAFSRRQTLDPKATQANRLIEGMFDLVQRTVGPEVEARFVPGEELWTSLVDPNQLENALLNLCINARDAMPGGGRLTIETNNRSLDERAARLHELEPGRYVAICVSDSGTGMSPEIIAKAFDPFFTTKPIGVGTGLGLSMIYGFARQSGGHVRIYSEVGEGTTVCIYLPRHLGEAEVDQDAAHLSDAPRAERGETVLVVDDEPSVRMLVTDVLEELDYTAIEAVDGAAGLKVLRSDARIDLLVSDVGLPGGMNGRQMADAARVGRPDLKVLFITGYAENAVVGNGHLDPGMHVMTKPFAMEALATRIRTLIEGA